MGKVYDYVCRKCWYTFRDKRNFIYCPKCKKPLDPKDRQEDILMAEE